MITLYKTDRSGRILYYSITDRQGHLFSAHTFTVTWGEELTMGREKLHVFDSRQQMDATLQSLVRGRIRGGYRVLYSYFRDTEYTELRPTLRRAAAS